MTTTNAAARIAARIAARETFNQALVEGRKSEIRAARFALAKANQR